MAAAAAGRTELLGATVALVVDTVRDKQPDTYRQLVGELAGERVALMLLGWGGVGLEVTATDILTQPLPIGKATTTCIVSPEVLRDILAGSITPLEAYTRRKLIVQTHTAHLVSVLRHLKGISRVLQDQPGIVALLSLLDVPSVTA